MLSFIHDVTGPEYEGGTQSVVRKTGLKAALGYDQMGYSTWYDVYGGPDDGTPTSQRPMQIDSEEHEAYLTEHVRPKLLTCERHHLIYRPKRTKVHLQVIWEARPGDLVNKGDRLGTIRETFNGRVSCQPIIAPAQGVINCASRPLSDGVSGNVGRHNRLLCEIISLMSDSRLVVEARPRDLEWISNAITSTGVEARGADPSQSTKMELLPEVHWLMATPKGMSQKPLPIDLEIPKQYRLTYYIRIDYNTLRELVMTQGECIHLAYAKVSSSNMAMVDRRFLVGTEQPTDGPIAYRRGSPSTRVKLKTPHWASHPRLSVTTKEGGYLPVMNLTPDDELVSSS